MSNSPKTYVPPHQGIKRTVAGIRHKLGRTPDLGPLVAKRRGTVTQLASQWDKEAERFEPVKLEGELGFHEMRAVERSHYEVRVLSPSEAHLGKERARLGQFVAVVIPGYELDDQASTCFTNPALPRERFPELLELMAAAPTLLEELCDGIDALLRENERLRNEADK